MKYALPMRTTTAGSRRRSANRRKRCGGFTPLEEILTVAAMLGCFVYPLSLAARAVGSELADKMDSAHRTLRTQPR